MAASAFGTKEIAKAFGHRSLVPMIMTSQNPLRAFVHTLGCKLNYAESSTLAESLREKGYELVGADQPTDLFVINTCSVTETAERECRKLVRRALRTSPDAFVVVTGCYAQLRPKEIAAIPGVDLVTGGSDKLAIPEYLGDLEKRATPMILSCAWEEETEFHFASTAAEDQHRTRAFLKIQDGCDYSCSFCTIPLARGASRSNGIDETIAEAAKLASDGFREIVLTGVNVGDFGRKSGSTLLDLLKALEADTAVTSRIRISSIEPNLLTDEIIEFVAASEKLVHHFHIPLQSGSPAILRMMQRRYTASQYAARIAKIRALMPDALIGADVIVGFPGETDEHFSETVAFLEGVPVGYLHVFTYSERPDTLASTLESAVPIPLRKQRNAVLQNLSSKKLADFYRSQIGAEGEVILEQTSNGQQEGFTGNYVRVRLGKRVPDATLAVRVQLVSFDAGIVTADPIAVTAFGSEKLALLPILTTSV